MDRVMDVFAGLAAIAMVTTIVSHKNTANIIKATGSSYAGALQAAMGQ